MPRRSEAGVLGCHRADIRDPHCARIVGAKSLYFGDTERDHPLLDRILFRPHSQDEHTHKAVLRLDPGFSGLPTGPFRVHGTSAGNIARREWTPFLACDSIAVLHLQSQTIESRQYSRTAGSREGHLE